MNLLRCNSHESINNLSTKLHYSEIINNTHNKKSLKYISNEPKITNAKSVLIHKLHG